MGGGESTTIPPTTISSTTISSTSKPTTTFTTVEPTTTLVTTVPDSTTAKFDTTNPAWNETIQTETGSSTLTTKSVLLETTFKETPTSQITTQETETTTEITENNDLFFIIIGTCSIAFLLFIILIIGICHFKRSQKHFNKDPEDIIGCETQKQNDEVDQMNDYVYPESTYVNITHNYQYISTAEGLKKISETDHTFTRVAGNEKSDFDARFIDTSKTSEKLTVNNVLYEPMGGLGTSDFDKSEA